MKPSEIAARFTASKAVIPVCVAAAALLVVLILVIGGRLAAGGKAEEPEEGAPEVVLTDAQRAAEEAAGGKYDGLAAYFTANTWTNAHESGSVAFYPNCYVETAGKGEPVSFAIADTYCDSHEVVGEDGTRTPVKTTYIDCVAADGTYFFMAMSEYGGAEPNVTLMSPAFAIGGSSVYVRTSASGGVDLLNVPEKALAVMGGDDDGLEAAISDYCCVNFPTARKAAFDGTLEIDYTENTAKMCFVLDNAGNSTIRVVFGMDTGVYDVATGR